MAAPARGHDECRGVRELHSGMTSELLTQLWHTAVLYVLAFVIFRLMGKRSISHLAPFDIAVVIIIGEAVAIGIEDANKSIVHSIVPIVALGFLQWLLTWVNIKIRPVEQVTQGVASVIVKDGQVNQRNLARQHMSQTDLTIALREQGMDRIEDVKLARLEPTGHVSVLPMPPVKPVTVGMMGLPQDETLVEYLDRKFKEFGRGQ